MTNPKENDWDKQNEEEAHFAILDLGITAAYTGFKYAEVGVKTGGTISSNFNNDVSEIRDLNSIYWGIFIKNPEIW